MRHRNTGILTFKEPRKAAGGKSQKERENEVVHACGTKSCIGNYELYHGMD